MYGIATNLVREHRRDEQRHIRAISLMYEATFRSTDDAVQLVERLRLASALTSLKAEWRSVVLMIGVGGLSYEDAAAALHIPVGTVRSRYSRTRTQLIANLADTAGHKGTGDKVS